MTCKIAVVILLLAALQAASPVALPDGLGSWAAAGETEVFVGDELFLYIDGGADIYHEYGFEKVAVRDYARGEQRVTVEAFSMTGSAFGIFSALRPQRSEPAPLCDGGSVAGYYARFWCGDALVAVTASTTHEGARDGVLEVSRALAARMAGGGALPGLLGALPQEHRVVGSEAHAVGSLGLRKLAPEVASLFRAAGVAARYALPGSGEGRLVILSYSDDAAAEAALAGANETAGPAARPAGDGGFELVTEGGTSLAAMRRGRFVTVAATSDGPETARALLALAARKGRSTTEGGGHE